MKLKYVCVARLLALSIAGEPFEPILPSPSRNLEESNGCSFTINDEDSVVISNAISNAISSAKDVDNECDSSGTFQVDIPGQRSKFFVKKNMQGSYWIGEDSFDGSSMSFIRDRTGQIHASITDMTTDNVISLYPDADGTLRSSIIPSSSFPPEIDAVEREDQQTEQEAGGWRYRRPPLNDELSAQVRSNALNGRRGRAINKDRDLLDDLGGNVDVMVVWTARAECARSDLPPGCNLSDQTNNNMLGLVQLAIAETNGAFEASGIQTRLHLAHAYRHPTYVEQDDLPYERSLESLGNGRIENVDNERVTYGADVVAMIVEAPGACGIAYRTRGVPEARDMFSVTSQRCATGIFSFGHEIAHNFGCK